jgi:hypothetical protein
VGDGQATAVNAVICGVRKQNRVRIRRCYRNRNTVHFNPCHECHNQHQSDQADHSELVSSAGHVIVALVVTGLALGVIR